MRYTLSVVSAVCLMALGQAAWSSSLDPDLRQRARWAVQALPATDRASAAAWLNALAAPTALPTAGRHLPLSAPMAAAQQWLAQYFGQMLQAHRLAPCHVPLHYVQVARVNRAAQFTLQWDAATLARWAQAWTDPHTTPTGVA